MYCVWLLLFIYDRFPGIGLLVKSVQFSCSVVSDCLRPHGLQHARPPCLSPAPRVYSNSCPLSQWCHPTISSSVLQSFPASGSFPVSQLFTSDGQSIGVSASTSVLPMNIQNWFPLGWTGWISLQSKGLKSVNTLNFNLCCQISFQKDFVLRPVKDHTLWGHIIIF